MHEPKTAIQVKREKAADVVIYDWVQHRYCRNCRLSREKFPTRRVFVQISVIIHARCCLEIGSIQGVTLEIYQEYSEKYSGA